MPEVFVDFIQGGNNLEGLYVKLEDGEKPEWNLLLAIIHSINTPAIPGGGDEQNVVCYQKQPEKKTYCTITVVVMLE